MNLASNCILFQRNSARMFIAKLSIILVHYYATFGLDLLQRITFFTRLSILSHLQPLWEMHSTAFLHYTLFTEIFISIVLL